MAYQRISPDHTAWVREFAEKYPAEWEAARERPDGSRSDAFIRRLAFELNKRDSRIGLNGKRGSDILSTDALAFLNSSAPGGAEVIDVIVGSTHQPSWQDATLPPGRIPEAPEGVLGKFIQPTDPGGSSSGGGTGGGGPVGGGGTVVDAEVLRRLDAIERRLDALTPADDLAAQIAAAIREHLKHLAIPPIRTDTRGTAFLAHSHQLPALRVVDDRSLPADQRPKE